MATKKRSSKPLRLTIQRLAHAMASRSTQWLSDNDDGRGSGRLVARISTAGTCRFYFRYVATDSTRHTVPPGVYSKNAREDALTLEQERKAARHAAAQLLRNGRIDGESLFAAAHSKPPVGVMSPSVIQSESAAPNSGETGISPVKGPTGSDISLHSLCAAYVDDMKARGRVSAHECAGYLRRHIDPSPYAMQPARDLTEEQAGEIIGALSRRGHKVEANHVRSFLMAAFNRAAKVDRPRLPLQLESLWCPGQPDRENDCDRGCREATRSQFEF
jgi:hypothetical protein